MAPRSLRILCFGASITSGFYQFGLAYHPYSIALEARLAKSLPEDTKVTIHVDGLPGDTVVDGNYWSRLAVRLGKYSDETSANGQRGGGSTSAHPNPPFPPYDWVVLQAGGNDLGSDRSPQEIFSALERLYDFILTPSSSTKKNSANKAAPKAPKLLSLTVTETSSPSPSMRVKYKALNDLIINYKKPGYHVANVCQAVPYWGMDPAMRRDCWDDGLHLRPKGYDLFGDFVGERLATFTKAIDDDSDEEIFKQLNAKI